jgi:threonine synthase
MRLVSTAGNAPPVDLQTALFRGLAPDGGLYRPTDLQPLSDAAVRWLHGKGLQETALALARHLLGDDLEERLLAAVVAEALDFPVPLVQLDEGRFVLELFHGPTLAFKDVGARFMARLMAALRPTDDRVLTVLTATSGDTGGAVAQAFLGLPRTQVVVLYPEGMVSPLQERQFTTLGGNVRAVAVAGTFDDCQRLAKQALADPDLRQDSLLTSANSINIGRLLPQVFYYFHGWAQLPDPTADVVMAVPSGNFGNLTAGLMAQRLGLPVARFVAATNVNDAVPTYLRTGTFRPRASVPTLSTAMDVGDPGNFPRMLALYEGNVAKMRQVVIGSAYTDEDTRRAIAEAFARHGYVLDPHSAVGYAGLEGARARRPGAVGIVLATAHPAKFAETVEPVIGRPVSAPERLAALLEAKPQAERIAADIESLRRLLRSPG